MALTDTAIRNAKPRDKEYKIADAKGLYILVRPNGSKLWRLKFRIDGKEKKLALGTYPEVSLAKARADRDTARAELADGRDPKREKDLRALERQISRAVTFASVGKEYVAARTAAGVQKRWSPVTATKNRWLLDQLEPAIGSVPIAEIKPLEILNAVKKIAARGKLESARRAMQVAGSVFRYAVSTARLESDPTRDIRDSLAAPEARPRAAIVEAPKLVELLMALDDYSGHYTTRYALQIAPHVFVRPGELRQAKWEEFTLDDAVWSIPAARMKMRHAHHVPLSRQVVALLLELKGLTERDTGFLFPSIRSHSRPMSENTLNAALRPLGFTKDEATAHGFRSTASTMLNEALDPKTKKPLWSPDAIEKALAHGDKDKVRGAYNRSKYWEERVLMAQWWSDRLDVIRKGADVVPIKPKRNSRASRL